MKKFGKLLILIISIAAFFTFYPRQQTVAISGDPIDIDIDSARDGKIYGDIDGLKRVQKVEKQLHQMKVREDHPRIFLTKENIPLILKKIGPANARWQKILQRAESGDMVNAAFAYVLLSSQDSKSAKLALNIAKKKLYSMNPKVDENWSEEKHAAIMALVYDWIYNGLTETERVELAEKLTKLNRIKERNKKIKNGHREMFETFHREEWIFYSYKAWPEIALSHHVKEAEENYKTRWNYDWYYGDAARMYSYAADGTPFEGYYYGADGCDWFYVLKTATGINVVDDPEIGWCRNTAYHMLYRLDFGLGREIFHKGVALGHAGILSYSKGISSWKFKEFLGRSAGMASDDSYVKWLIDNISGLSSWGITTTGYSGLEEFKDIAYLIYDRPDVLPKNPMLATYEELPYARLFPGGKEAYMRTSFRPQSTNVGFTAKNAYTMTSHSDFDVNTFMIYKEGNLSPDTGVYDAYQGQANYFKYQKNTVAHNNILIVDPKRPDFPKKLGGSPDPGGTELVNNRTFGVVTRYGVGDAFLHDPIANWAEVIDFKTTKEYDYIISKADKAYGSRLDEFIRSLVFIRKDDNAYIIIFDRINSKKESYVKKWLMHFVDEPIIASKPVDVKHPWNYQIYKDDYLQASNVFDTAKLHLRTFLPENAKIARIGGEGYEFYVEGSKPKNWSLKDDTIKTVEKNLGATWEEVGTWRIEIMPEQKQKRDYFLNVVYTAELDDVFRKEQIQMDQDDHNATILINDEKLGNIKVSFTKIGEPKVNVEFGGKDGI